MSERTTAESIQWFAGLLPERIAAMNEFLSALPETGDLSDQQECELLVRVGDVDAVLNSMMNRVSEA